MSAVFRMFRILFCHHARVTSFLVCGVLRRMPERTACTKHARVFSQTTQHDDSILVVALMALHLVPPSDWRTFAGKSSYPLEHGTLHHHQQQCSNVWTAAGICRAPGDDCPAFSGARIHSFWVLKLINPPSLFWGLDIIYRKAVDSMCFLQW